jgi:hypothetical protein
MRVVVVVCGFFLAGLSVLNAGEASKSIEAFDGTAIGGRNPAAISFWKWSPEDKGNAKDFSRLEIRCKGEGANGGALKISVFKPLPPGADFYALWTTGLDYLPPDAIAVRMRAKVVSGNFSLTVGSPTAYFANSDVWARPQVLEPGGWKAVEFSLISNLERNFRRAIFSAESPIVYYTRWIQEPMRIMVGADSCGELWLDDIELVLSGKGSTFPVYREEKIRHLAEADLGRAFTFSTDDKEFDLARTPGKTAVRKPAVLNPPRVKGEPLEASQRGLEEMSFIGIPVSCPEGANGFRVTVKMAHQSRLDGLAVDFLALVSQGGLFPWTKPAAGEPAGGFDLCLSPARTKGMSWGFYHARRIVLNGEWATLVIPFEDFVCAYGSGELRDRHQLQQPLAAGEVVALAIVSPFRQAAADTYFTIRSVEVVRLEDDPALKVSFPKAVP